MTGRKAPQKNADGLVAGSMFIGDIEITERYGAEVLLMLDEDPATQKGKGTWPPQARSRGEVEQKLAG